MQINKSLPLINDNLAARQSRWGALISELEDDWDDDNENGAAQEPSQNKGLTGVDMMQLGTRPLARGGTLTGGLHGATGVTSGISPALNKTFPIGSAAKQYGQSHVTDTMTLYDWIVFYRGDIGERKPMSVSERKKYLEKSVHILHSLAGRIVGVSTDYELTTKSNRIGRDDIVIHPNFITTTNVVVKEPARRISVGANDIGKVSADFVECGDSIFFKESSVKEDETRKKFIAMDALGRMAYEMCMLEDGPSIDKFCPKRRKSSSDGDAPSLSNAMNIQDGETNEEDDIIGMLRKIPRTTTSEKVNRSGLVAEMLSASIPFPLCRFISDLLDDENDENSIFGRSEHSFSSFEDVISDLKQMMDNPEKFLHASSPDRWKLSFGDKLYGRDQDLSAFMDAAERVAPIKIDPLFDGLLKVTAKRKEVIMVSGHSGAGKSRLVRFGGSRLEKSGWRFLRCKFDRVVHPEPLSILAYAFDEYFGSIANEADQRTTNGTDPFSPMSNLQYSSSGGAKSICQSLKASICQEGLAILATHIPSLRLLLDVQLPSIKHEMNETKMATLFLMLLQEISSKNNPVLFFIDDLQWADPLSLSLFVALVKRSGPDHFDLSRSQNDSPSSHIMFVGSYRDNEVDERHPLAKVIDKFKADKSMNMTNISLSRFSYETLNEMLSESLCVPMRRVRSLSELVIHKTDGQPLHVIEFIQALTMDNLLTHSFDRGWEWDADSIDICPITESVAELYAFKLQRLPGNILLGLQILSLFGSQIDQRVISFVADYDGDKSVDIATAIQVASKEGLIEKAAQLVCFSHDMIQKATIDSIQDLVRLLRKVSEALLRNASAVDELDSVLFVAVDLINRIGSDAISSPEEGELFAELNLRAGSKAISVPDFAGGAQYAENGITFLSDDHWETQYELSLGLYETSVVSHFSSMESNRDQLKKRINAVFEHAKDFSDKFKTHYVWIKLLSMTDLSKAIRESLIALERLGEPLDSANIDYIKVCDKLVECKEQFSGEKENSFLSLNHMTDLNKMRAMKIMASLIIYYHQIKSFLGAFIACKMIQMTMDNGHCEDSVFGTAAFASALVSLTEDIEAGSTWGRITSSLMKIYKKDSLVPSIHAPLYGIVFVWKEPFQSTLEPLAEGIRLSFAIGNVELAFINTIYYIMRSFSCGKNIRVLTGEVEALARQHGNHFGNDNASGTPLYNPLLQFYLLPLDNVLRSIEGDIYPTQEEEETFPSDKFQFVDNDAIMQASIETEQYTCFHAVLTFETNKAVSSRNMDRALKCTNLYFEHFLSKQLRIKFVEIYNMFYEALITFYFMRQTGEDHYLVRGGNALRKIREWAVHSDWNFKNKLLLVEAEFYNTQKEFDKAAKYYEASVEAAREHKFVHEEAIASECAAIFFLERGLREKSLSYLRHSFECYEEWGAFAIADRVKNRIQNEFGLDLMEAGPKNNDPPCPIPAVINTSTSRKRQIDH